MWSVLIILGSLVAGRLLQEWLPAPARAASVLNKYVINVVLPAMALYYLPGLALRVELLWPVAAAWISFGVAWLLFGLFGKWRSWPRPVTGCLIITCGLANTSFVGFPVIMALYGEEGLQIALLIDQAGSFLLVGTLALVVAAIYGSKPLHGRQVIGRVLRFPPFIFFLIGLGLNALGWSVPDSLSPMFTSLAATLTPAALMAVGLQLKLKWPVRQDTYLSFGLGYKLVGIPLLTLLCLGEIIGLRGLLLEVTVMEMAMPPMVTAAIIAMENELAPQLAAKLVALGIGFAALSLPLWYLAMGVY